MSKKYCKDCLKVWSGKKWPRKSGKNKGGWDYECHCGSKKKPVKEEDLPIVKDCKKREEEQTTLGMTKAVHRSRELRRHIKEKKEGLPFDAKFELGTAHERRVLVIPDLHAPFILDGYIDFLVSIKEKYNCNHFICLGDMLDNHYGSFHSTDPDGYSAQEELTLAAKQLKEFAKYFPVLDITIGNHDAIPNRKAFNEGLSKTWIKPIKQVLLELGVPCDLWEFKDNIMLDGVLYTHGNVRQANKRMLQESCSVISGHWHSKSYIEWLVNLYQKSFAMQLGCGVDRKAFSMAYGKDMAKPIIDCGVVLENGKLPIIEMMEL